MDEALMKRVLPHSIEAEQSVIGSMLMDKEAIIAASEIVTARDFYQQQYGIMFETMVELFNEGKPVDLVTLQDRLKEKDVPPEVSSLDFVRDIITTVPTSANVKSYANIVREKAVLRRLIKVNEEIANTCYAGKEPLEQILASTEKSVFDLLQSRSSGEFVPIRQVALNVLEKIEAASKTQGTVTGIPTGFIDLDYKTSGMQPSDFVLIAARPSMGKTAFVLNLVDHVAVRKGLPCMIFSLEMSKEQLVNRMLAMESNVDSQKLRTGNLTDSDWDAIVEVLDNNPDGLEEMWEESFFSDDPETVLTYLKKEVEKAYPALPENGYQIKYVPESLEASMSPAFYLTPPMDMPQNNVIYINRGSGSYDVLTVLAHEGYPGHLYQNVYYLGREVPEVRHALNFTAYSEGWATYVENRSYLFEDNGLGNVMGELMRRDSSVTKAVYALLDIRVNYEGWNREETASFLQQIYNLDEDTVNEIYDALIANPGNYLQYYAGCLEIERMRAEAEEKLGAAFDEKAFHTFILGMGPAPFTIIRDYFDEWLKTAQKSG